MSLFTNILKAKNGKIFYAGNLDKFHDAVYNYNVLNKMFATKQYGSTAYLYMPNGKVYAYGDHKKDKGKGFHICKTVKKDIEKWIRSNPDFNYNEYEKPDYKEQLFNLELIKKNIGSPVVGVDITNCYFQTAYNLGYISEKVYKMGNRKPKEWKEGRNASIGSLAKTEINIVYAKGTKKTKKLFSNPKKKAIRNHIISEIYKMFTELIQNVLHEDYYMYLTDCIYVDVKHLKTVQDFYTSKGYASKYKQFALRYFDAEKKYIIWWDYKKERNKWYCYANHQVYKSQL